MCFIVQIREGRKEGRWKEGREGREKEKGERKEQIDRPKYRAHESLPAIHAACQDFVKSGIENKMATEGRGEGKRMFNRMV